MAGTLTALSAPSPAQAPSPALTTVIVAGRSDLNARVAAAQRAYPRLAAADVEELFVGVLSPIADAIARRAPEATADAVARLLSLALPLVARKGMRATTGTGAVWREVLPHVAQALAEDPERVARALTNIAFHVQQHTGNGRVWRARVLALALHATTVDELIGGSQVAAWASGLAQYRFSALAKAARLPASVVAAALRDIEPSEAARAMATLSADRFGFPSSTAQRVAQVVWTVGGFRGLGGPWLAPPRVACDDDGLCATDGDAVFGIHADCFGAVVVPRGRAFPSATRAPIANPRVTFEMAVAQVPTLKGASSHASDGDVVVLAHPSSHFVAIVALVARPVVEAR